MLEIQTTRIFDTIYQNSGKYRIMALRGGARSSKTWSTLQHIARWLVTGHMGDFYVQSGGFSVVRETLPSMRATVYKDFIEILHQIGYYHRVDHRKTQLEFHYKRRFVAFFPADDTNSQKIRGRQHTFFYLNEANTISQDIFDQMIMRTEQFCILDYNPAGMDNWCHDFIEGKRMERGDVLLDVSTYRDNPFLSDEMVTEIEGLKDTDRDLWEVYTKGNWVKSRNTVFENVRTIKRMPTDYESEYFGLDFGFVDPTVCVRVLKRGNDIFIEQLFYRTGTTLSVLAKELENVRGRFYCDHDPMTIKELRNRGLNARKAMKGKDSIRQGLNYIRTHNIYVLESSIETLREFRSYKYKVNLDGSVEDKPLDKDNHAPDATRYALSKAIKAKLRVV